MFLLIFYQNPVRGKEIIPLIFWPLDTKVIGFQEYWKIENAYFLLSISKILSMHCLNLDKLNLIAVFLSQMIPSHPWKAKSKTQFPLLFLFFLIWILMAILFQTLYNINTALREDEFILTFTEMHCETKHLSIYGLLDIHITHFHIDKKVLPAKVMFTSGAVLQST